jgi:hypothetical protein
MYGVTVNLCSVSAHGRPGSIWICSKEHEMSVTPVMPTTGTAWTDDPAALITTGAHKGFKQDTCVWNVAWNELRAQGKGAENTPSLVAKFSAAIIKQFNEEVAKGEIHGQAISNPNDVTTGELTVMAKATYPGVPPKRLPKRLRAPLVCNPSSARLRRG